MPDASPQLCPPNRGKAILLTIGIVTAFMLRIVGFSFVSDDMKDDMIPWAEFIAKHGIVASWSHEFLNFNYPPAYLYLLTLATFIPLPRVYAIKVLYVVFDCVLAAFVGRIVQQQCGGLRRAVVAATVLLLLPTVIVNSSWWGQCDAMYASGLAGCIAFLMEGRLFPAMVAYGVAMSMKPQAIFMLPLLGAIAWQRRIKHSVFLIPGGVYVVLALPAWLAGRHVSDLLLLYVHQDVRPARELTLGAPNIYQWLGAAPFQPFCWMGIGFGVLAAWDLMLAVKRRYTSGFDANTILRMGLVSLLLLPYVLPAMHERYFFGADAIAVAYAFSVPRGWIVLILVQIASFLSYLPFLIHLRLLPNQMLAFLMGLALLFTLKDLFCPKMQLSSAVFPVSTRAL